MNATATLSRPRRHVKNDYAGRLLFYEPSGVTDGLQELVMLGVFRKEGQETPQRERKTAETRMKDDIDRRANEETRRATLGIGLRSGAKSLRIFARLTKRRLSKLRSRRRGGKN
jgi:hypothetical protein